jgi:nucleoid DNA-binding protein
MFLRIVNPESAADKKHRKRWEDKREETRSEKAERARGGGSQLDAGFANICYELGIDFTPTPQGKLEQRTRIITETLHAGTIYEKTVEKFVVDSKATVPQTNYFKLVRERCEGRRVDGFSEGALRFLKKTYDVEQVEGPKGKLLLHFKREDPNDMSVSLLSKIAKRTEMPPKQVKEFYEALVKQVHRDLRDERKSKLPELGLIQVKYQEPRKAGKRPNPWKKGEMMKVKARDASNKVKFRVAKDLKVYVAEKVEVEKPKSKSKSD